MFFPGFRRNQMLVFIRRVTESLSVHEDLLGLVFLRSTARGLDLKEAVLKLLRDRVPDLPLSKLVLRQMARLQ